MPLVMGLEVFFSFRGICEVYGDFAVKVGAGMSVLEFALRGGGALSLWEDFSGWE